MGPLPEADGHDAPQLIDEVVLLLAAMIDDVPMGWRKRFDGQSSRMK